MEFLQDESNPFPWAHFHEVDEALDGSLTNVGVILPERMYIHAQDVIQALPLALIYGYATINRKRFTIPTPNDKHLMQMEAVDGQEVTQFTEYEVELPQQNSSGN